MVAKSKDLGDVQVLYSDIEEEPIIEEPTEDADAGDLPGPDTGDGGLDEAARRRLRGSAAAELNRLAQTERSGGK